MKKHSKKLVALVVVLALTLAMSVSAFAAGFPLGDGYYVAKAYAGQGMALNVYTSGSIYNNCNVTVYTYDGSASQSWRIVNESGYWVVKSLLNGNFALNYDRRTGQNGNCTVYTLAGNEIDARVGFNVQSTSSQNRVYLLNYSAKYLTATGNSNGSNVLWASYTPDNTQVWGFSNRYT